MSVDIQYTKLLFGGTSLVVQWLSLCTPNAGDVGKIPGQRTRSHIPKLRVHMLQVKTQQAAPKTWCSQISKFKNTHTHTHTYIYIVWYYLMKNCLASLTSAWVYFRWMPRKNACMHTQSLSHVQLFVTPWTVVCQAPLSTEVSRQKYWSGLPFPTPGDLLDPGIKPASPVSYALVSGFFTTGPPRKPYSLLYLFCQVKGKVTQCPTLVTPCTIQSMEFSRPVYWSV